MVCDLLHQLVDSATSRCVQTQTLWQEMFPAEAFDLNEAEAAERSTHLQAHPPHSSFKYKIADAVDRQQAFLYQVGLWQQEFFSKGMNVDAHSH